MPRVVPFPGPGVGGGPPDPAVVGGKGASLMRLAEAGLEVPPGVVLTAGFFASWFDEIRAAAPWTTLAGASADEWPELCDALKSLCPGLALTPAQREALDETRRHLVATRTATEDALFAVRSSSPEEDLASASFAGGYETRLGVRLDDLEAAVRHCFASSLDARVLVYKKEHGFNVLAPRIAVVVQQQLDSAVAGVGFSLNPLTNDYDEAVIDANWGLGESVVAGITSPDHFVVDKVDSTVIDRRRGAKQVSIWLAPEGGTVERRDHRSAELTLSDAQLRELTDVLVRIETLYGQPMDVEWAYVGDRLHVLQARPVTTWVPLPPELVTRPGERRRLYLDGGLSKGMTTNTPISPMGLDWMARAMTSLTARYLGRARVDPCPERRLTRMAGGRMYVDLSNLIWLSDPRKFAKNNKYSDALMAEVLANLDVERYRASTRPAWTRGRMVWVLPGLLWRLKTFFVKTIWALVAPERVGRAHRPTVDAIEAELRAGLDEQRPFAEAYRDTAARMPLLFDAVMPTLTAFFFALVSVDRVVGRQSGEVRSLAAKLGAGFTDNVVIEMGLALFRMARILDASDFDDVPRLAARIEEREMTDSFLQAWDAFMTLYGCRGPMEMDLASPRYGDDPELVLRQMASMTGAAGGGGEASFDPEAAHRRQVDARREASAELPRRLRWPRRAVIRRIARLLELFAGTRDAPKYHIVLLSYAVRRRALVEGARLVAAGRLDAPEHIFDLTLDDVTAAAADASLDLRARREEHTRFLKVLKTHVTMFPAVIDSRGRILRPPPRKERPGELSGMPVSPGVVTGRVRLLHDPNEKPIEKGDVLVAYTTDPGWTPLFVNASAVVLEIGGLLQHGAVVAREYGKPCVAGIDRVMTRLHDGQRVEVDGTAGVVRILS